MQGLSFQRGETIDCNKREGKEVVYTGADGFVCLGKGVFDVFCFLK